MHNYLSNLQSNYKVPEKMLPIDCHLKFLLMEMHFAIR